MFVFLNVLTHFFGTNSQKFSWELNHCPIPQIWCFLLPWENVNASESNKSRPSSIHLRPHQSISSCVSTIKRASASEWWASWKVFVRGAVDAICPCHWHSRSETQKERGIKSPRRTIVGVSKGGGWGRLLGQWAIHRGAFFRWTASSEWLFMGKTHSVYQRSATTGSPQGKIVSSAAPLAARTSNTLPPLVPLGIVYREHTGEVSLSGGGELMKPMHISANAGLSQLHALSNDNDLHMKPHDRS